MDPLESNQKLETTSPSPLRPLPHMSIPSSPDLKRSWVERRGWQLPRCSPSRTPGLLAHADRRSFLATRWRQYSIGAT